MPIFGHPVGQLLIMLRVRLVLGVGDYMVQAADYTYVATMSMVKQRFSIPDQAFNLPGRFDGCSALLCPRP